jgi:hypothetical protein
MPRQRILTVLASACAAAALLAPAAASAACPPPPGCQSQAGSATCPPSPYAAAVLGGGAAGAPAEYWRLGEGGEHAADWMLGVGTTVGLGAQVATQQPGALACDADGSVSLSGATADDVWESHLVGDPDGARAAAPGTEPFAFAIWVKPQTLDANSRRIAGHEQAAGGWFVAARDNQLTFSRYQRMPLGTAWSIVTVYRGLPLDSWSFVVATYGADHLMRLYVDGVLAGSNESHLQLPDDSPGELGGHPDRGRLVLGASGRWWSAADPASRMWLEWDGGLDEAAWYHGAGIPTAAGIERLWQVGTTGWGSPQSAKGAPA